MGFHAHFAEKFLSVISFSICFATFVILKMNFSSLEQCAFLLNILFRFPKKYCTHFIFNAKYTLVIIVIAPISLKIEL